MASPLLGVILKSLRVRIDRNVDHLGAYKRLPSRRGARRVKKKSPRRRRLAGDGTACSSQARAFGIPRACWHALPTR